MVVRKLKPLTAKEKSDMRKLIKENFRIGGSRDFAKGYQQALKDCKAKVRRAGARVKL